MTITEAVDLTLPATLPTGTLGERAMLATLSISMWTATKHDKKVSAEVATQHQASNDAGRYNKKLVNKDGTATQALVKLQKIATKARQEFRELTVPWFDDGTRILPVANMTKLIATMQAIQDEWNVAYPEFESLYPQMINEAQRSMNGLFSYTDYPPVSKIGRHFKFSWHMVSMPGVPDFRDGLGTEVVESIRQQYDAGMREVFVKATEETYGRVAKVIGHMSEKLHAYTGKKGDGGSIFRDSLVTNVQDLAELLPSLNITGDAGLAAITERITKELLKHDADTLRASDAVREQTAASADAILKTVEEWMA